MVLLHALKPGFYSTIIIPPVYEVYRGYIVFAFPWVCVCVCVCVFVNLVPSKITQELLDLGS